MKAKNTSSKISKIYNQEVITEDKINKFKVDSTNKKNSVINATYTINLKNKIHDFSTEWMDLDTYIVETMEDDIYFMHKEFRIMLSDMPIKYLPLINVQVLCKYNDLPTILEVTKFRKSYFFQVSDVIDDVAKNVELIVGVGIDDYYPVQVKVLITISNSEFYI